MFDGFDYDIGSNFGMRQLVMACFLDLEGHCSNCYGDLVTSNYLVKGSCCFQFGHHILCFGCFKLYRQSEGDRHQFELLVCHPVHFMLSLMPLLKQFDVDFNKIDCL
jgi:hypothetical protein